MVDFISKCTILVVIDIFLRASNCSNHMHDKDHWIITLVQKLFNMEISKQEIFSTSISILNYYMRVM
jgi:hypothetical protein